MIIYRFKITSLRRTESAHAQKQNTDLHVTVQNAVHECIDQ